MVGTQFETGNSTVAQLPVGSILEVIGQGQLEVRDVPQEDVVIEPGVEFTSKRGLTAVVVDLTSTGGLNAAAQDGSVFYVEDGAFRVRRTSEQFVKDNLL